MALIPMEYSGGGVEIYSKTFSDVTNSVGAIPVLGNSPSENFPILLVTSTYHRYIFFEAYGNIYAQFYQVDNGYLKPVAENVSISGTLYYIKKA